MKIAIFVSIAFLLRTPLQLINIYRNTTLHIFYIVTSGFRDNTVQDSEHKSVIKYFDINTFDLKTRLAKKTILVDHVSETGRDRQERMEVVWYYVTPDELKQELQQVGFTAIEMFGSFKRQPLYDEALKGKGRQIIVAKR